MKIEQHWQGGWCRDLPSHEDLTIERPLVQRLLRRLPSPGSESLPEQVDQREFCAPVVDQGDLPTSSAHASVALAQYFEKRVNGKTIVPSRWFVHHNACRLSSAGERDSVSLRTSLKSMLQFGLPPERFWPYEPGRLGQQPDAFLYGFQRKLSGCRYVRLDQANHSGTDTLRSVKTFLNSGFAMAFGFSVPDTVSSDGEIYFPSSYDTSHTGHAALAVGYDDRRRILSEKGALLIQNSWGSTWGEDGFGWLPYRYVVEQLAVDFWLLMKPKWLRSGELYRPL